MALGLPAIATPNQIELRAIQTAISNARQRIEALEGATNTNAATAAASATAGSTQINALRILLDALAVRVTALESEIVGPDDSAALLAVRSFQPHVPLVPTRPVDDSAALLAARAFMPRAPIPPEVPDDEPDLLANRVFMPHVLPVQAVGPDDSAALLAARAFMPHVLPASGAPAPAPPSPPDDGELQIAARAFMPHVPLSQPPLPQEMATILATQIFGA